MYISIDQIRLSLDNLKRVHPFFGMSFLAFKKAGIPVGGTKYVNFTQIATDILERHYHPSASYQGYYNPFQTSDRENRWVRPRYPSTSLQRITKDTFSDALIHPTKTEWGWREDYVQRLAGHLDGQRIPAFDLAVWLFRYENWPEDVTTDTIISRLFTEYSISESEIDGLFDTNFVMTVPSWLEDQIYSERELIDIIGSPPGSLPEEGAALRFLELRQIGPASLFCYEPSERLNIITGDNSLGKTFLLECIWWALTGEWLDQAIQPRNNVAKSTPKITFSVSTARGRTQEFSSNYNWDHQEWTLSAKRATVAGLVVYARFDGSFAVWDPARVPTNQQPEYTNLASLNKLFFKNEDIWYGLQMSNRRDWLCNGLLRDWVSWQTSGSRYQERWKAFVACLRRLSPLGEMIEVGEPTKLSISDAEIPTIKLPYGDVPIIHASAGVQRAVALTYILVWSWFRHLENSVITRREPQRRLVLLVDEVEAHLHPRWQRTIVPSLMDVISELAPQVSPQIHLATHSPMIMASVEAIFNEEIDDLHHLKLDGRDVVLEELPFIKRGRIDLWLMSEVFGLTHARSRPGEKVIEDAKKIQASREIKPELVREINDQLVRYLAQDDDFWPRWRYFAKQHGVE
jgi:hypothetical protein